MPSHLKRAVRERMTHTGETYPRALLEVRARARPERPAVVIVVRRRGFGRQDGSRAPGAGARAFAASGRPSGAPA
jgi:hypothetical protein